MRNPEESAESMPVQHPEAGRRYSLEELEELASQNDPWALSKMDEWDLSFSNEYVGPLRDRCPDEECDQYGEPVTLCYGEDGEILDVDHGGWGHAPGSIQLRKAS